MTRTLKNTRIKGLPPKVKAQVMSSVTGSYGFKHKLTVDNRSGFINIPFDDTKVINFKSYSALSYGSGLSVGSPYLTSAESTSSLSGPGELRKGVGDDDLFISFGNGQELKPFKDDGRSEADGKSYITSTTQSQFWSTGSNFGIVGEGFDSPLWAKSSFSIDVSAGGGVCAYHNITGPAKDAPFVYYNFSGKTYEKRGPGHSVSELFSGNLTHVKYFDENCLGFAPSLRSWLYSSVNGVSEDINSSSYYNAGLPIDSFGFPWHAKYFAAKDSPYLMQISSTLPGPFLLEKMVVDFSASFETGGFNYDGKTPVVCTFFILNQRRSGKISERRGVKQDAEWANAAAYPATPSFPRDGLAVSSSHQSGTMDLVGVMRMGWIRPNDFSTGSLTNENRLMFDVVSNADSFSTLSFNTKAEVTIKSPSKNNGCSAYVLPDGGKIKKYLLGANQGGRNGIFQPSSRNKIEPFGISRPIVTGSLRTNGVENSTIISPFQSNGRNSWTVNPYLLMPTDELIFGWQTNTVDELGLVDPAYGANSFWKDHTSGSLLSVGRCIVTFYGSFIREGKEYHDTLNQLISSVTVHEAIG